MKKISLYEFKDLSSEIQSKVIEKETQEEVEFQINFLDDELNSHKITEKEYYQALGCSRYYAESTAWFVPSCYYEHNKSIVDDNVSEQVKRGLYTKDGRWVQLIEK